MSYHVQATLYFCLRKKCCLYTRLFLNPVNRIRPFGFDDTYLDLARALRLSKKMGKNFAVFAESRKSLEDILGGRVEYDETSGRWQYKKGNQKFPIGVTSEGIKKIAILDTLLGNRYLDANSIVLIDEPESGPAPRGSFAASGYRCCACQERYPVLSS